jgi:hypothetical protein
VTPARAHPHARGRRGPALAAALVVVGLGALLAPAAALMAAPTLALALALMAGWLPGEAAIERLRRRRASAPRRRAAPSIEAGRTSARGPRGRIVICFSLANRPPPLPRPA